MSRGWLLSSIALGIALGALFAAFPRWDLDVAGLFFDPHSAKFPLAVDYSLNLVRRIANWVPFLLLAPAVFALLRKLVFPNSPMLMAPSVVVFLIGSFLLGPALTANALLKENWGRPGRISCSNSPVPTPSSPGGTRAAPASGTARSCRVRRARLIGRWRRQASHRRN